MISDTLTEVLSEIERYQRWPKTYKSLRKEITKVKVVMNALRLWLDSPPPVDTFPRYGAAKKQLRDEIAGLNVDGLVKAVENLKDSWPSDEELAVAKQEPPKPQGSESA